MQEDNLYVQAGLEISKVAIEYTICLEQVKAAKQAYHNKLKDFDTEVYKQTYKQTYKRSGKNRKLKNLDLELVVIPKTKPMSDNNLFFKDQLLKQHKQLPFELKASAEKLESTLVNGSTVNEYTAQEYNNYTNLRKKANYLKSKLTKTVHKYFHLNQTNL